MLLLTWMIVGLVTGLITYGILPGHDRGGVVVNIAIGVLGAIVAGAVFSYFGYASTTGVGLWSILVAIVGAIVLLFLFHALAGRRAAA